MVKLSAPMGMTLALLTAVFIGWGIYVLASDSGGKRAKNTTLCSICCML